MSPLFVLSYCALMAGGLWFLVEFAFAAAWSPTPEPPRRIWIALSLTALALVALLAQVVAFTIA